MNKNKNGKENTSKNRNNSENKSENNIENKNKNNVIKNTWPAFVSKASFAMAISAVFLNVIIISNLLWPNEAFHSIELGLLIGSSMFSTAFSGIFFGFLADKYSRKNLYVISVSFYGVGLILTGFIPIGLGNTSFYFFIAALIFQGFFSGAFNPIETSFVNDKVEESMRSKFYGSINAIFQLAQVIGMLFSSLLFQNLLWRQFYWILGTLIMFEGILIAIKLQEPKRGIQQEELKEVLNSSNVEYKYHLTKETARTTIFRRTNIVAFIEGIFTTVLLTIPDFLLIAYISGPPHNIAPFTMTIFMLMTGLPGAIVGSLVFAKVSDTLAEKNFKFRVYLIIASIVGMFGLFLVIFLLPVPHFSPSEGRNIMLLFTNPEIIGLGALAFLAKMIITIYSINQPPILQKINLPEAQGKISSANQFLELIGQGLGPMIAGVLLIIFNQNYQLTVLVSVLIGMIGAMAWLFGARSINKDIQRISSILDTRAIELKEKNEITKELSIIAHR
ncbi:MAG: MFS transporter [Promethearchaeota archaeon]